MSTNNPDRPGDNGIVDSARQIPAAPYYVLCNDTFLSGWGLAGKRTNTLILPCDSYQQAEQVWQYARNRGDQRNVRILNHKPRLYKTHLYQVKTINDYPRWYRASQSDE